MMFIGLLYMQLRGKEETVVINFEEELKKFHPSMEVEDIEDAVYNHDLTDLTDILLTMIKQAKENEQR